MRKVLIYIRIILSWIWPYNIGKYFKAVKNSIYLEYSIYRFRHVEKSSNIGRFNFLKGSKYLSIRKQCSIGKGVILTAIDSYLDQHFSPCIPIRDGSSIGYYSHITSISKIHIGKHVPSGPNILITDNSRGASTKDFIHIAPNLRPLYSKGPVIIEDNVWIWEKSSIMPSVHIGY